MAHYTPLSFSVCYKNRTSVGQSIQGTLCGMAYYYDGWHDTVHCANNMPVGDETPIGYTKYLMNCYQSYVFLLKQYHRTKMLMGRCAVYSCAIQLMVSTVMVIIQVSDNVHLVTVCRVGEG